VIIREAKAVDASSIASVVVDTWQMTYKGIVPQEYLDSLSYDRVTDVWTTRITDINKIWPGWFVFVVENNDGKIVGFAGGGPSQGYGLPFSGELGMLYVLKAYQRHGFGRQLAVAVAVRLKQRGLKSMLVWVFTANPYRAFYEALEGRVVAEKTIDRYGGHLTETAYGWDNLEVFKTMIEPGLTF
jgi:GNAT superfamily N-acetyltransferase